MKCNYIKFVTDKRTLRCFDTSTQVGIIFNVLGVKSHQLFKGMGKPENRFPAYYVNVYTLTHIYIMQPG